LGVSIDPAIDLVIDFPIDLVFRCSWFLHMFKVVVTFMSVSAVLVLKSGKFCMQLHLDKRNNCSLFVKREQYCFLPKEAILIPLDQRGIVGS